MTASREPLCQQNSKKGDDVDDDDDDDCRLVERSAFMYELCSRHSNVRDTEKKKKKKKEGKKREKKKRETD